MKEKIMKGFLALVLCFCFIGFSETSKANEQEYREACAGGDPAGCYWLGNLEERRGHIYEAVFAYSKSCDLGDPAGCYWLRNLEFKRSNN